MNKKTSLIALTSLTATAVALCAAFFSVTGIAKLFAGASLAALVMAGTLEFGKIVGISFLYQYWDEIPKVLKAYLTTASIVLMLITSVGIYGFLSAAYQATADQLAIMDQQSAVTNLRKERYQEELNLYLQERERLSTTINELSSGLANNVIQYVDAETGQLITTTSSATRNALQEQLRNATEERSLLALKIEEATDSITSLETQAIEANMNNDIAAEVGPLRFVSNLTGWPMDMVVNIFAIMIVLVFDPLAIALVISVNFLLKHKPQEENEVEQANFFNVIKVPEKVEIPTSSDEENYYADYNPEPEPTYIYAPEKREEINAPEDEEPYQIYVYEPDDTQVDWSDKELEEYVIKKYLDPNGNGIPDFMEKGYNWNDINVWKDNPLAIWYKKNFIDNKK